ncbi:DUF4292 domain-containing protein [uncultured Polaribacter sp.]|uniref:DUF4292 domain-containing protein n=1 Tax=uncultured Polaribacter sp. TaxID=174711 RepID=UPI0026217365|nr:DUF4292 domain-containing protein [uncultured Polaribacter sp.]
MRFTKYIVFLVLVFSSCKSNKVTVDANGIAKKMSAKKVAKKHNASNFDKETVDAKFKANFNNGKLKQSISVQLKIKKDEVIWLKGTKFINIFKIKITPEKVSYYSPLEKRSFEGDFTLLEKVLGVAVNFNQLQNLFLGQAMLDLKETKSNVVISKNSYVLTPKEQALLFNAFFSINSQHFKLDAQEIVGNTKNQKLSIKYPSYKLINEVVFPKQINIKAQENSKLTTIDFQLKSVLFNTPINTSFKIPSGYKPIVL